MQNNMDEYLSILLECPLFKGLPEGDLTELLGQSGGRILSFGKGDMLAAAGETVHFLHIMLRGRVRGEMTDAGGKVIKIEDLHPPEALATAFLYGERNCYPVNIIADSDVLVYSIPSESFLGLMQASDVILRQFVSAVSSRAQFLSGKIKYLSFTSIKGKLAQYILELSELQASDKIMLPISQSSLSELFGVARPSVGRAIVEMREAGLIRAEGRYISLLDRKGLSGIIK